MPKKCVCGYENQDDAIFCRSCGTSLAETKTKAPPTQLAQTSVKPPPASPVDLQPSGVRSKLSSVVGKLGGLGAGPQQTSQDGLEPGVEYKKLVSKLEKLTNQNKAIEEELRLTKDKIDQIEKRAASNSTETDETLRGIRATMTRLSRETDRKLP